MANSIFAGTPCEENDRNAEPLLPAQPSLIDLWTVGDQWQSRQEGWELLASGNDGGKWAICSTGDKGDAEMERYVVERARTSLRHWLAAVLARLLPVFPERQS